MSDIRDILLIVFLALICGAIIFPNTDRDDSDPAGGHSGLHVYTDSLTGVQYLGGIGGLTVRLNTDGTIRRAKQ